MTDMQKLIDTMSDISRSTRSDYHITLGKLIDVLERLPPAAPVTLDDETEIGPTRPHSYRGHYTDLAFEVGPPTTAGALLAVAKAALGETFEGYKGGDYVMRGHTPLWISRYGSASGRAITGIMVHDGRAQLRTHQID